MKHTESKKTNRFRQQIMELSEILSSFGVEIDKKKAAQLEKYATKIVEWNHRINLISTKDVDRIIDKHVTESLAVTYFVELHQGSKILDIGSGAGFPGIPLKIIRPDLEVVLLDSKRMRTLFLRDVINNLILQKINVVCSRAESLQEQEEFRETFDYVLARAVTKLKVLWEWSRPLLKSSGQLVAFKGGNVTLEISELSVDESKINEASYELLPGISQYLIDKRLIIVKNNNDYC